MLETIVANAVGAQNDIERLMLLNRNIDVTPLAADAMGHVARIRSAVIRLRQFRESQIKGASNE